MEDDDDFLEAVENDNKGTPEPKDEPPKPEEKPEEPEPPKEPDTAEPPHPEAAELVLTPEDAIPPKEEGAPTVPLKALLDVRDELKTVKADLSRFQQSQQPAPQRPDPYEDPDGAAEFDRQQVANELYQRNLYWSEQVASIRHGEDTVKAAKEWGFKKCDEDPFFNAKVATSPDPVGFVVAEYKREEIASKVTPDEFAQFQQWKQAQDQLQQGGQPPPAPSAPEIPQPSLASAPSAGTILNEPVPDDEEIFQEVMPKR